MQYPQWAIFDSETQDPGPMWKAQNYDIGGAWRGGTSSIFTLDGSYYGDWVYIQLPEAIVLTDCILVGRSGYLYRAPSMFRVYGSNDAVSWTAIHNQTSPITYSSDIATVADIQSATAYSYFGLVVSALNPGSTAFEAMNFRKWKIFGKVLSYIRAAKVTVLYRRLSVPRSSRCHDTMTQKTMLEKYDLSVVCHVSCSVRADGTWIKHCQCALLAVLASF